MPEPQVLWLVNVPIKRPIARSRGITWAKMTSLARRGFLIVATWARCIKRDGTRFEVIVVWEVVDKWALTASLSRQVIGDACYSGLKRAATGGSDGSRRVR